MIFFVRDFFSSINSIFYQHNNIKITKALTFKQNLTIILPSDAIKQSLRKSINPSDRSSSQNLLPDLKVRKILPINISKFKF